MEERDSLARPRAIRLSGWVVGRISREGGGCFLIGEIEIRMGLERLGKHASRRPGRAAWGAIENGGIRRRLLRCGG